MDHVPWPLQSSHSERMHLIDLRPSLGSLGEGSESSKWSKAPQMISLKSHLTQDQAKRNHGKPLEYDADLKAYAISVAQPLLIITTRRGGGGGGGHVKKKKYHITATCFSKPHTNLEVRRLRRLGVISATN